jgi:hypothetical protein
MLERDIERRLAAQTLEKGGRALKFVSPGLAGVTDRLVLLPVPAKHQRIVQRYVKFVEVKAPGEKPRPLQLWFIREVQGLGHWAGVVDSPAAVRELFA